MNLPNGFFCRDRQNINGQQQVARKIGQIFYHFVGNEAGIVTHEQDAPKLATHFKISGAELQSVRADQVAEVNAALDICGQVEPERRFFARPEEVMQKPQPVGAGNGVCPGIQPPETGGQVGIDAAEIGAGLLDLP